MESIKKAARNIKEYAKELYNDESGMELLEFAILVTLVAGVIAVVIFIFGIISDKISEAGEAVENINTNNTQQSNPWSGGTTPQGP